MLEALEEGVKGGVWFSLIDKLYRPRTLKAAWIQVKAKKGAGGSDHQSIQDFASRLEENLKRLEEELCGGSYQPRPIRRVYIDKPGSNEKRPLGIPAVRDRVVQAALRMVIEPIFERAFAPMSYGFRPGRGCKDALRVVDRLLKAGYTWVVDADIKAYFDSIPHEGLMDEVRSYIADGRVLKLVQSFLKQDILDGLKQWEPEEGTPQGAVISPLLANIYLHPVDKAMAEAGFQMIRYADDFVILSRSQQEAQAALTLARSIMEQRGLTLHPDKTRVVDASVPGGGFDFLGYHFEAGKRWPRKKSLNKFKDNIRRKTKRCNALSMEEIIVSLNRTAIGWFEYFKHSHKWTFSRLDPWIRRRLRSILRKRQKLRGISRGRDHQRWPNQYFRDVGLFSLEDAHRALLQSS
ncbi:MAG: group II intron reverse transcriptase/maturase [Anaerolineae bacterium]|nr:group II intron reverse transcriptase/maturase [Anaerolineae bacterium]